MFSWHVVALIDEETCKMQHFLTLALASSTAEVVSLSNQLIALNIIKDLSDQKKSISLCLLFVALLYTSYTPQNGCHDISSCPGLAY